MDTIDLPTTLTLNDHCSFNTPDDFLPEIPILNPETTKYEEFFENYLKTNKPCIFTEDVTSSWVSRADWVTPEGVVNFDFLQRLYGDATVSVTQVKDEMSMDYGGMNCEDMKFTDYVEYWKTYIGRGYPYSMPCRYLKDWHIVKDSTQRDYQPYVTPIYFRSDWLNEVSEDNDFRFAYMGPKGSWTPFHADVYGSFSWSANVVGKKKWRLYPPGKEKLFMQANGQVKYDYQTPGEENADYCEVIQNAGEIIFVPSGWYHIVWNLTDTISINHNWINGSNICHVWNQLLKAFDEVKKEIDDLKDMDGFFDQCQLILQANHGMNYEAFISLLEHVWNHRLEPMDNEIRGLGAGQAAFDMKFVSHLVNIHMINSKDLGSWRSILNKLSKRCE